MPLGPAPAQLLDDAGMLRFGQYRGALPDVDISDVRLPGWPGASSGLRLKRWQHFCIVHPDVALTFAIVHTGYLQLAWVQAIDRATGQALEHAGRWPLVRTRVARSLWDDHTHASGSGIQLKVHNHLDAGHHDIALDSEGSGHEFHARLRCHHDPTHTDALVVCLPVGRGRGAYSHKVPLPVSGELRAFGRDFRLEADACTAIVDIHQAHYPRETWWRWATFIGRDAQGRRVAVNLTRNVVTDEDIHENALWIDGRLELLGPSAFALDEEPWTAGTADGTTSLRFAPQGERGEDLNLGLVVSRFRQRFGTFSGRVSGVDGPIELQQAFGLFEDHSATW